MARTNMLANYGSYRYVVTGPQPGPYHTIQSAINEVLADGGTTTVFVRPGTYTENLTLYTGINIQGSDEGEVIIVGTHTPPAAGTFTITNCKLSSATHAFSSAAAGTTVISVKNCVFNLTLGYVFNMTNWTGDLFIDNCTDISASNGIITNAAASALDITDSSIGSGAVGMALTGVTTVYNSRIFCSMALTGNANVSIDGGSVVDGSITLANPAVLGVYNSRIVSGVAACITTTSAGVTTLENVVLDSSAIAVIAGTGVIELGSVTFNDSSSIAGTITYAEISEFDCSNINIEDNIALKTVTAADGQLIIGATGLPPAWASLTSTGGSITISPGANTLNIDIAGASIYWQVTTLDAVTMVHDNGYIPKNALAHLTTYTLPTAAPLGSELEISGFDTNLWRIAQGAGKSINFGDRTTTPGAGGSLSATKRYDSIRLVCVTTDTVWNVISSVGNLTIV